MSGVASRYIPDISGKDSAQETRNHSFCLHFTWNGLFSRSGSGNAVDHFFCFTFHHFLEEGILKASFELRFDQISNFNCSFEHRVIIFPSIKMFLQIFESFLRYHDVSE